MFSRRAGFLVEKSVKLLILFYLKSKIDKKTLWCDSIKHSRVHKIKLWKKNWKEKLETEDSKITFFSCLLRNGGSDKILEQTEERNGWAIEQRKLNLHRLGLKLKIILI